MTLFYKEKTNSPDFTIYYLFNEFIVVGVDKKNRSVNGRIGFGIGRKVKYFFGSERDIYLGKNARCSDHPLFHVSIRVSHLYIRYYVWFKPEK